MKLFNEYENKNLQFLLNYLNFCYDSHSLSEEEIENALFGGKEKLTSENIVDCILNREKTTDISEDCDTANNLNLLYHDEDQILPLMKWDNFPLPERMTSAERIWLRTSLADSRSDLFIAPYTKAKLIDYLESLSTPDCSRFFDTRTLTESSESFSSKYVTIFKTIVYAIVYEQQLEISLSLDRNDRVKSLSLFPIKLSFNEVTGTFQLFALNLDTQDVVWVSVGTICFINASRVDKHALSDYRQQYKTALKHHLATPISLQILYRNAVENTSRALNMSDDRAGYIFSSYHTESYEENGNLMTKIYYYNFQRYELIRKILSLGKYCVVKGPESVRQEVIEILKKRVIQ